VPVLVDINGSPTGRTDNIAIVNCEGENKGVGTAAVSDYSVCEKAAKGRGDSQKLERNGGKDSEFHND
jgi:hypothetical protein